MGADESPEAQPCASFDWIRVIDGIKFGETAAVLARPPKKRPAGRTIKLIAYRLAFWGDPDGSRVKPSVGLVAEVCEVDHETVKTVLAILREFLLLTVVTRGGRGRGSTCYQLSVPADLLETMPHRAPAELERGASARAAARAHPYVSKSRRGGADVPVDEPSLRRGRTAVELDDQHGSTAGMPDDRDVLRRGCTPIYGGDAPPRPTRDLPPERTDQNLTSASSSPARPQPLGDHDSPLTQADEFTRQAAALREAYPGLKLPTQPDAGRSPPDAA